MRRLLGLLLVCAGISLTACGCHHTAGISDCDQNCYYGCITAGESGSSYHPRHAAPTVEPMTKAID